jgi:hypothetical protein
MEMPGGGPATATDTHSPAKTILAGSMGDRKVAWIRAERKGEEGPNRAFPLCYS